MLRGFSSLKLQFSNDEQPEVMFLVQTTCTVVTLRLGQTEICMIDKLLIRGFRIFNVSHWEQNKVENIAK